MNGIAPRPVFRLAMLIGMVFISHYLWNFLSYHAVLYLSGSLGAYTLIVATFAWNFKDKVKLALNGESVNSASFLKVRKISSSIARRAEYEVFYIWVASLCVFSPVISSRIKGNMYEWMLMVAFIGSGEVLYSFLKLNAWLEQINDFKDKLLYDAKIGTERTELIKKFESGSRKDSNSGKWKISDKKK